MGDFRYKLIQDGIEVASVTAPTYQIARKALGSGEPT